MIHDLNEITGMECTHNFSEDLSYWDDNNTIRCKVECVYVQLEDKFPYTLNIAIGLVPIVENNLDEDELLDMQMGVCLDSLIFD